MILIELKQTLKIVFDLPHFQRPRRKLIMRLVATEAFLTNFEVFGNVVKHCVNG